MSDVELRTGVEVLGSGSHPWSSLLLDQRASAMPAFACGLDGVVRRTNRAFAELVGLTVEELLGRPLDEVTAPADQGIVALHATRAVHDGRVATVELRHLTRTGRQALVQYSISPVLDAASALEACFVVLAVALGRRDRSGGSRPAASAPLRDALELLPVAILVTTVIDGEATSTERHGRYCSLPAPERTVLDRAHARAIAEPGSEVEEVTSLTRGERMRHLEIRSRSRRSDDGPLRIVTTLEDVTARHDRERRLTARAKMVEQATDAVILLDATGRVGYWNAGAESVLGWSLTEAVGRPLSHLVTSLRSDVDLLAAVHEHPRWSGEVILRGRGEREIDVLCRSIVLNEADEDAEGVLLALTDVTDLRAAELAVRRSERLLHTQFAYSAIGQAIRSRDDVLEAVNPALVRMLGYESASELIGRPAEHLAPPTVREERRRLLAPVMAGEDDVVEFDSHLQRRDGSIVEVRLSSSVIRDDDGLPFRFVSTFHDVSEQRGAERRRDDALTQLRRSSQMKGDLLALLGHQLKNPVATLLLGSDAAGATWAQHPTAETASAFVSLVARSAARINQTVNEVLDLVAIESETLVARPAITRVGDVLDTLTLDGVDLSDLPRELRVRCDAAHLAHILDNLISNALIYASGVRSIRLQRLDGTAEAGAVVIVIADEGPGVDPTLAPVLFERFSRGDSAHPGSGMGLFIARQLALANGGDLALASTGPHGSAFALTLPIA